MSIKTRTGTLTPEEIAFFSEGLEAFAKITPENDAEKKERLLATYVSAVRGQVLARMEERNISVTGLAKRIGVSKNAVSRHLAGEGDMRISTAISLAYALGEEWSAPVLIAATGANYSTGGGDADISDWESANIPDWAVVDGLPIIIVDQPQKQDVR